MGHPPDFSRSLAHMSHTSGHTRYFLSLPFRFSPFTTTKIEKANGKNMCRLKPGYENIINNPARALSTLFCLFTERTIAEK